MTQVPFKIDRTLGKSFTMQIADGLKRAINVGGVQIGPADFLFAALEVLTSGAEIVTVSPRDQLGSFAPVRALEHHRIAGPGKWCIHSPDFTDRYLSDRLRWQLWTARHETADEIEQQGE